MAYIEALRSTPEEEMTQELVVHELEEMRGVVQFMGTTVDDFNRFFSPSKEQADFNSMKAVSEVGQIVVQRLKQHDVALKIDETEALPLLHGNVNEYKQVVLNLLNNSIDAVKEARAGGTLARNEEGWIHITAYPLNGTLQIRFEDNGGGIAQESLEKLFSPYHTTKGESGGSGFGLYLSQMIVEGGFGGTIRAENGPFGAIFTVTLPVNKK